MKKILVILISLTISINSFAENAVKVEKGNPAPFTGILLTPERAEKAMKAEKKNIVLKDLAYTQEEITEYHKGQAREYRKKLTEAKFEAFWTNTGYFVIGVILTGFTFKISGKIQDI